MHESLDHVFLGSVLTTLIDHRGRTPKKLGGDFVPEGVPVLSAKSVKDGTIVQDDELRYVTEQMFDRWMPEKLRVGDILLTSEAPLGEVAYLKDKAHYCLGQRLFALRSDPTRLDSRFLYYALRWDPVQHRLHARATGTTAQGIRQSELVQVELDLPPLPVQQAISNILGTLDDKIELNRRMNATLEGMARALFRSWFVDFDPVRAKAEGRQPAGMDAATAALFPGGLEETESGEVPRGWTVDTFDTVVDILSGGTPKTTVESYWNGGIPWFSVVDAPDPSDVFVLDTERHISQAGLDSCASVLLPKGTSIISARGTVGKVALLAEPMAMNQSCYGIRDANGRGDSFVYYLLRQSVAQLQQSSHGSVFDTITRRTFSTHSVITPPLSVAQAFNRRVVPYLDQILVNRREARSLAAIRDALESSKNKPVD